MASSPLRLLAIFMAVVAVLGMVSAEDTLFSGESLTGGQFLENGRFRFIMQTDCNLVLYVDGTRAVWASGTNGKGSTGCQASLLSDGNLVIVAGSTQLWKSNTARGPNSYRLIMQSDGNAVIYGAPIWATGTVQK